MIMHVCAPAILKRFGGFNLSEIVTAITIFLIIHATIYAFRTWFEI